MRNAVDVDLQEAEFNVDPLEDAVLVAVTLFPGLGEVHPFLCAARVFGKDSWQLIHRFTLAHPISWNQTWSPQGTALDGYGRLGHHCE